MQKILTLTVLTAAASLSLQAAPPPIAVPEIHVASGLQAIALLSGVALMVRGRRK